MEHNAPLDSARPVKELLERFPEIRPVLASHGIDTCCGGVHPLEEACAARRVPLPEVLRQIEEIRSASARSDGIPPTMSIRDIRRTFPSTIPVFERYGLGDCGGEDGPDEPVAWFATVHRIELAPFLADLRSAAACDLPRDSAPPAPSAGKLPFFPGFILGAIGLTLTLGATAGLLNFLRIASGGDVPLSHRQIHGHTQIFGFAAMFLMGIAYHALPRILGIGSKTPRSSRTAFYLMFSGVVLRNVGQPLGFFAVGRLLSLLSAAMETAAGILFALFVFELLSKVPAGKYSKRDPMHLFVLAGTINFLAAIALSAMQGIWLAGHAEAALPVALTEPCYFAALFGFLLAWIYGFGHRVVSLFLGVGPFRPGSAEAALGLQAGGVAAFLLGYIPGLADGTAGALRDSGTASIALSALVYLVGGGFVWRRVWFPMLPVRGRPTAAIRLAFACLGVWSGLEIAAILIARLSNFPAQNPWWHDAARHVFTVGFLTLIIVGMSLRILPVFSGKPLWSPKLAYLTYGLILLGTAMRLLQYPAAFQPVYYVIGSYMGIPVVAGLVLFAVNLVKTMRSRTGTPGAALPPAPAGPTFASTLPVR
jgi:hypothetical protein